MLEGLKRMFRGFLSRMITAKDINSVLEVETLISSKMQQAIKLWGDMYRNQAPWLGNHVKSLNLPVSIASEMSRLTCLEFESEITGSARAEWLNEQYNNFLPNLRRYTEYACAKGGVIFKPFVIGEMVLVDCVGPENFIPTTYDAIGAITGCVFLDYLVKNGKFYTKLEHHEYKDGIETIKNLAYISSETDKLGVQISLYEVEEWSNLEAEAMMTGLVKPTFTYFKMPHANNIDEYSPIGVSIYSRAVELIEQADIQYSRYLWEYEAGETAINVDPTALIYSQNNPSRFGVAQLNNRLYRGVEVQNLFEIWSPTLRDSNIYDGINNLCKMIEFKCGLSYGTISDPQSVEKTATEIISSKQRSYSAVKEIQTSLQTSLDNLIRAIDAFASMYSLAPEGKYEVMYVWDDSIIVDKEKEKTMFLQEISAGIRQPWEYRVKFFGEEESIAMQMAQRENILFSEIS